jgi:hypothetical protein
MNGFTGRGEERSVPSSVVRFTPQGQGGRPCRAEQTGSTNAIHSLNCWLEKVTRKRLSFSNLGPLMKL